MAGNVNTPQFHRCSTPIPQHFHTFLHTFTTPSAWYSLPARSSLTVLSRSWHLLMCYPCSFPAAHRAWGTIPDGTSAALVAVRCLSVWPLGRQYFLLMGLEHFRLHPTPPLSLFCLKVHEYLSSGFLLDGHHSALQP